VFPIIYKVLYIPGGAGFFPSTLAPENMPGPKRKLVFQPSIFRCYVSLREGTHNRGDSLCTVDEGLVVSFVFTFPRQENKERFSLSLWTG